MAPQAKMLTVLAPFSIDFALENAILMPQIPKNFRLRRLLVSLPLYIVIFDTLNVLAPRACTAFDLY